MATVNIENLKQVLHALVHRHGVDEATKNRLHDLVEAVDGDAPAPEDKYAGKTDDEVLAAAFAGDTDARAEFERRRAQSQASTVSPVGGSVVPPSVSVAPEG